MKPLHFIDVLIQTAESSYAAWKAGLVSSELTPVVLTTGILAANQAAANNWPAGGGDRMGALAAAMVRGLYPETAEAEAGELCAMTRLHMSDAEDPAPSLLAA